MNSYLENTRKLLEEARSDLMNKQNVVATGIGYKSVNGKVSTDLAIICSVLVKKSKSSLHRKDLIPQRILDLPTDVNPTGIIRTFGDPDPTKRFRPAPGGVSIGHLRITAGTLGCLVKKNNEIYILSNNHVLANSNEASIGDLILQPGPYDGGDHLQDQIAHLSGFIPIHFEENDGDKEYSLGKGVAFISNALGSIFGSRTRLRTYQIQQGENKVDAAIAKPIKPEDVKNEILGIGALSGTKDGELDMKVKKSGRTTGFTEGTIEQIDVSAQVSYGPNKVALFVDQLMAGPMSQGGDSGSAVLSEDNKLVGLLFAGSDTTTIINRINHVFESLEVTLP